MTTEPTTLSLPLRVLYGTNGGSWQNFGAVGVVAEQIDKQTHTHGKLIKFKNVGEKSVRQWGN